jgi:arylsulfatase A-like enzyme
MKSRIAVAFLSCLPFLLGFASRAATQPKPQPPNIIFILADDLGWTELGCYSNHFNETQNLDRMAGQGMRFTQAYASAPVCSPTRAAFLTGRTPASLGITDYLKPDDEKFLSPNCPTINKQLKQAGYVSGLVGKWHLNGDYARQRGTPAQHGLDEVICSEDAGIGAGDYWHPYKFMTNVAVRLPNEYLTDRLNLEAVEFIERHKAQPFFLYLAHYAPHQMLDAKPDKLEKFNAKPGAGKSKDNPKLAAMLESIDDGVGLVMQKLDELKLADNTVLIFMSDNGGERSVTGNFPLRAGKSFVYEGGLRVPCIVRWPGHIKPSVVCDVPIITHDFYPTFMEIAGLKLDRAQGVEGKSLASLFHGASQLKRDTLYWHYPLAKPHFLGGTSASAIRKGDFKLIECLDSGKVELYALKNDLSEARDLSAAMPKKTVELRKQLADWRKTFGYEKAQKAQR